MADLLGPEELIARFATYVCSSVIRGPIRSANCLLSGRLTKDQLQVVGAQSVS